MCPSHLKLACLYIHTNCDSARATAAVQQIHAGAQMGQEECGISIYTSSAQSPYSQWIIAYRIMLPVKLTNVVRLGRPTAGLSYIVWTIHGSGSTLTSIHKRRGHPLPRCIVRIWLS